LFHPVGGAIAEIINKNVPGARATVELTGGAGENPRMVGAGEIPVAFTNANLMHEALLGIGNYKDRAYPNLRGLLNIMPSVVHILVLENSGIRSVADLTGRRVALGPAGGGPVALFPEYARIYGLTMRDITPSYVSFADGTAAMRDGHVHASIVHGSPPHSVVMELGARGAPFRILSFEREWDRIRVELPYLQRFVIPKGTYKGINEDVVTIAVPNIMFTNTAMSDEMAYQIVKNVYEHISVLVGAVSAARLMKPETGWQTIAPLHPGAERFFREKGVIK
jgi:TRAP transporter TAXI family solute receptor